MNLRLRALGLVAALLALPASAHEQTGLIGGLTSGILHPLTGLDHLVAMVAVGLWGAELGGDHTTAIDHDRGAVYFHAAEL